jgi:hypothetical protein
MLTVTITMHVPLISVCLVADVLIFLMWYALPQMLVILLNVILLKVVFILIFLINVTREINVMITIAIKILDALKPIFNATIMIYALMTAVILLLVVYMFHMIVMTITLVRKTLAQENVIMNGWIVTITMHVQMISVYQRLVVKILHVIVMIRISVQKMTVIHKLDVFTQM